jgi:lichenan operon transcriptional antiterminator
VNILQGLNRLDKNRFKLEFLSKISGLIRKPYYISELDVSTPSEVISILCDKLEEGGIVDSDYKEVVLKREELSSTSFVNLLAIPHAFGTFSNKSTIAVAHLKNPIKWGSFEVRLVMLFAIDEENQRMIKMFFDWVSAIINDNKQMAMLSDPCDYDEFIEKVIG